MPLTPIHFGLNAIIYYLVTKIWNVEFTILGISLLLAAELIDLDHLLTRPIYHPRRNPFKTHLLHKNWHIMIMISIAIMPFYPLTYLGFGIISHLLLDFIYTKYWLKIE
jgi:hypothetical protein